ncbi:MAG: Rieske 2Fe-2S domain-containing protein, partial [Proteobacteria bacterium]|nr:Rieske 2Fe-2S domain-containing protein [Pseudomonadota bacterium]
GEMMRQYWLPALASSEVIAGGDPIRLMLLGEKLIAFRDVAGKVGVMDHRCPHRCASLFYGRNEGGGIRCVYHGWKFDADGHCTEMPNLPPEQDFSQKVKARAYKVTERAGLIWVYMGAREVAPPMPEIEASLLPEDEIQIMFAQRECNWLQALEGDIDTSHFSFLHVGSVKPEQVTDDNMLKYQVIDRAPSYHVADTDWGTMYSALRPAENGRTYWRFAHFGLPFWTWVPQGDIVNRIQARAWVPMDDTHTMFVSLSWTKTPRLQPLKDGKPIPGALPVLDYLPNTTDWYGRWRPAANASNDYRIDREAQRNDRIYTGISHIHMQDQAITESMGDIVDHSFEHLAPSDQMITRTRRRLLMAARALRDNGQTPPGVDTPDLYTSIRSGEFIAPGSDWRVVYAEALRVVDRPLQRRQAAE